MALLLDTDVGYDLVYHYVAFIDIIQNGRSIVGSLVCLKTRIKTGNKY